MSADRLLGTLLRSLQTFSSQQDTPRFLGTAASLLTTLTNPLNIELLTAQILSAPALWERPDGLQTSLRVMGVFHSAGQAVLKHHHDEREGRAEPPPPGQFPVGGNMTLEEWTTAVVKGANERSQRWKHLMVLGGLRLGLESNKEEMGSPSALKKKLDAAFVKALNLAVGDASFGDELGAHTSTLVLNHMFPILSDFERSQIDYDGLLPVLVGTAFFSKEGLQSAYFLAIDHVVIEVPGGKFHFPLRSQSYRQIQSMLSSPLAISMGPLARLIAHSTEHVRNSWLLQTIMEDIVSFAKTLSRQWRHDKLSQIDPSEEAVFLLEDSLTTTLPTLWKLLRMTLFATTIVLRGVMGRIVADHALAADSVAPILATQVLQTLRDLYFISSRQGASSFSQYTFVYFSAIDVLAQYPLQADGFLKDIRPTELGRIPKHPLDRCLDLYFLNTAEHFTLILSAQTNEDLLVAAAAPYLASGSNRNLLEIFEAAHSVMLAVLSAPQSAGTTAKHLPFYFDALFKVFPTNLSPRQFRLAFKTLIRVAAPPSPLSASNPDLPATLLEMVHHRATHAPTTPLPVEPNPVKTETTDIIPPLSEQAVLVLTLVDALPFLPVYLLDEWLPLSADLINIVEDPQMRHTCRDRLWEVVISGEMDPERSQVCVAWWGSRGGRERTLFARQDERPGGPFMSGALQAAESKL